MTWKEAELGSMGLRSGARAGAARVAGWALFRRVITFALRSLQKAAGLFFAAQTYKRE